MRFGFRLLVVLVTDIWQTVCTLTSFMCEVRLQDQDDAEGDVARGGEVEVVGRGKVRCGECDQDYASKDSLRKHSKRMHSVL